MAERAPGWDPEQYLRYADERARPFADLLARIPVSAAEAVLDLGCGPGSLTRGLVDLWPDAVVTGVDNSADMIAAAAALEVDGRLKFVESDLREFAPDRPVDVVIANAVLHWVPDHLDLIGKIGGWLSPGGVFAFQVPDNFDFPSHVVIRELRTSPKWHERLGAGADRGASVEGAGAYQDALLAAGLVPDVWTTTYLHLLTGDDPVLEWVKGTALRPVLTALADDPDATADFLAECGRQLRSAYPQGRYGTVFPFRRIFAVGRAGASR